MKSYTFNTAKRGFQMKHMKSIFRGGVNPASGNFPAGSRFKFIQTPVGGRGRR